MNQMQGLQQHYSGMNGVKATVLRGIILPSSNTSVSSSSCSSVLGSVHSTLHGDGICSFTRADFQQIRSVQQNGYQKLVCRAESSPSKMDLPKNEKMIVAITGATGFIGSRLVQKLLADRHQVRILTRSISKAQSVFPEHRYPNLEVAEEANWVELIHGATGVVNLAGLPISRRWTPEVKAEIKKSRVGVTAKVVEAINAAPMELKPKVLVSSTAVGYYGTSETSAFDETSPSGKDYLAEVCREWEAAAQGLDDSTRLVLLRSGIVLDKDGGALAQMVPTFSISAGGPLGSGKQWISWVHRDDLVSLIMESLSNPAYEGVINGTAPNPVRVNEMCDRLGAVLGRPSWLPVPEFALRVLLGEGASVVLEGQRVLPKKAQELGFTYKYRFISDALKASFPA
ncbi:unnamed protein product [Sphagnum troendelagicum]|uniref:Uncharacterized protein n=1 Tax=Sphagnum troendelagicum TaxID=128251 RepID=A0ABP0TI84_9BRYO